MCAALNKKHKLDIYRNCEQMYLNWDFNKFMVFLETTKVILIFKNT